MYCLGMNDIRRRQLQPRVLTSIVGSTVATLRYCSNCSWPLHSSLTSVAFAAAAAAATPSVKRWVACRHCSERRQVGHLHSTDLTTAVAQVAVVAVESHCYHHRKRSVVVVLTCWDSAGHWTRATEEIESCVSWMRPATADWASRRTALEASDDCEAEEEHLAETWLLRGVAERRMSMTWADVLG